METTDSLKKYLKDVGRYPLLSKDEEIELAKLVQLMLNPPEDATPHELQRINGLGRCAKNRLIESNLRLVISVAKKYQNFNIEISDLIQEGNSSLMIAVDKFYPTEGFKFSTYAYWWIRQGITRAITNEERTIILPTEVHEEVNKLRKIESQLHQKLGRKPSAKELAAALKLSLIQVVELLKLRPSIAPLALSNKDGEYTNVYYLFPSIKPPTSEVLELDDYIDYLLLKL